MVWGSAELWLIFPSVRHTVSWVPFWEGCMFDGCMAIGQIRENEVLVNFPLFLITPPPPPKYKYRGILKLLCPSVVLCVRSCPLSISWTTQPFFTRLGMVVYNEAMCHMKKMVHSFQCQGHSKSLHNLNMTIFLLYLLNCWSVRNQLDW